MGVTAYYRYLPPPGTINLLLKVHFTKVDMHSASFPILYCVAMFLIHFEYVEHLEP